MRARWRARQQVRVGHEAQPLRRRRVVQRLVNVRRRGRVRREPEVHVGCRGTGGGGEVRA
jgi:hypothetical protein